MEAVLFCGIQASGKTTFYKEHFLKTHIRISLDMLHTRNKEKQFLNTCFHTQQKFVVDNTNVSRAERQKYIEAAKAYRFKLTGYFFQTKVEDAIIRNNRRINKELIPVVGIRGTYKKLQAPTYDEGFDHLYIVQIDENSFSVTYMQNIVDEHIM